MNIKIKFKNTGDKFKIIYNSKINSKNGSHIYE